MADMVHAGQIRPETGSHPNLPRHVRVAGTLVRSVFIATLITVTWSISIPSTASRFAHLSSGDMMRALIGLAMCIGMVRQLIRLPKDDGAYRTWVHIGLALGFVFAVFMGLRLALA